MIEVILRGSPEDIVLFTSLLNEYSDIILEMKTNLLSSHETVIQLKVDLQKVKRLSPNQLNQFFLTQATQLFQTNMGRKLQRQFEQAISCRVNDTKCQQLRLQTLAIIRKNMICEIEKLIDQKVTHVQTTGVTGVPVLR